MNLSLVHAPYRGDATSDTLEDESHAIFGTRDEVRDGKPSLIALTSKDGL